MSTDRDLARVLRSWLHEDRHEDADRVLDLVLAQVDTTPQRRPLRPARRLPIMNNAVRIALVAAVVVVIAFLGIRFGLPGLNVGGPTPTSTPTATLKASATPEPTPLETASSDFRTYVIHLDGASPYFQTYQATVTLPNRGTTGWTTEGPIAQARFGSGGGFSAWTVSGIYPDPCRWTETPPDPDLINVNAPISIAPIVAALARQPGRNASEPTHVTLGGWPATRIELSLPADIDLAACDAGQYRSWSDPTGLGGPGYHICMCDPIRDQRDAVYVLDIDRGVVVIDAWTYPGATSDGANARLEAILASLVVDFGPP